MSQAALYFELDIILKFKPRKFSELNGIPGILRSTKYQLCLKYSATKMYLKSLATLLSLIRKVQARRRNYTTVEPFLVPQSIFE